MPYTVVLEPSAQRDLRRLPKVLQSRVLAGLRRLQGDPRHRGTRKLSGFEHQWRLRVGEYRALYEVDDVQHLVHVYRVAHRSESYR